MEPVIGQVLEFTQLLEMKLSEMTPTSDLVGTIEFMPEPENLANPAPNRGQPIFPTMRGWLGR